MILDIQTFWDSVHKRGNVGCAPHLFQLTGFLQLTVYSAYAWLFVACRATRRSQR